MGILAGRAGKALGRLVCGGTFVMEWILLSVFFLHKDTCWTLVGPPTHYTIPFALPPVKQ